MISLNTNSTSLYVCHDFLTKSYCCFYASCVCASNSRTRLRKGMALAALTLVSDKDIGFLKMKRGLERASPFCSCTNLRSKKGEDWDGVENVDLETEILNFMSSSGKPGVFPSKRDLMDAGRVDLVEAITRQGGWLAMGWDLEIEEGEGGEGINCARGFGGGSLGSKVNKGSHNENSEQKDRACDSGLLDTVNSSPVSTNLPHEQAEAAVGSDSGIEGILNRLEKERNLYLGISLREKGRANGFLSNGSLNRSPNTSTHSMTAIVGDLQRIREPLCYGGSVLGDYEIKNLEGDPPVEVGGPKSELNTESWRDWSMRRAGFSDEFEAAEISSVDMGTKSKDQTIGGSAIEDEWDSGDSLHKKIKQDLSQTHVKTRLQHLQSELSSTLKSLRSNMEEGTTENDQAKCEIHSFDDFGKLSDTWELQENEILNAQGRLRSMRTKLAVLEGKMALALVDARRILTEKQRRIDHAHRASQLLRSACIVWPKSASEVLLAGSFDGWAVKRRMEKSETGIFSIWLKLYPGRYEIKFIVDGQWKVDPLRAIVNENGYENNLLIIT